MAALASGSLDAIRQAKVDVELAWQHGPEIECLETHPSGCHTETGCQFSHIAICFFRGQFGGLGTKACCTAQAGGPTADLRQLTQVLEMQRVESPGRATKEPAFRHQASPCREEHAEALTKQVASSRSQDPMPLLEAASGPAGSPSASPRSGPLSSVAWVPDREPGPGRVGDYPIDTFQAQLSSYRLRRSEED